MRWDGQVEGALLEGKMGMSAAAIAAPPQSQELCPPDTHAYGRVCNAMYYLIDDFFVNQLPTYSVVSNCLGLEVLHR